MRAPEEADLLRAIEQLQVQLKTFNEQDQRVFSLRSQAACHGGVLGCPWCRRPLQVEVAPLKKQGAEEAQTEQQGRGRRSLRVKVSPEDLQTAAAGQLPAVTASAILDYERPTQGGERPTQGGDLGIVAAPTRSLEPRVLSPRSRFAHCSVLFGDKKEYFLGAMMLGWSLLESQHDVVLLVTKDVPACYRSALQLVYSHVVEADYLRMNADLKRDGLHGPSSRLFKRPGSTRFADVFTKLQVLSLTCYERVLFLDLDVWVRDVAQLDALFEQVPAPAALQRGENPGAVLGGPVPYEAYWRGYERKVWVEDDGKTYKEHHPAFEQASGINSGVMLLEPSAALLQFLKEDMSQWDHPGHYATYMPEQEYLGRMLASLDRDYIEERYGSGATVARAEPGSSDCWSGWSDGSWSSWGHGAWNGNGQTREREPPGEARPTLQPGYRDVARAAAHALRSPAVAPLLQAGQPPAGRDEASLGLSREDPPRQEDGGGEGDVQMAPEGPDLGDQPPAPPRSAHRGWHYLPPCYNFEIDKHVRIPFDFSSEHKRLAEEAWDSIAVFHYSGTDCKPWSFCAAGAAEEGSQSGDRPSQEAMLKSVNEKFADSPRIVAAVTEWLLQLARLEDFLGIRLCRGGPSPSA